MARELEGREEVVMWVFRVLAFLYRFVAESKESFILEEEFKSMNL